MKAQMAGAKGNPNMNISVREANLSRLGTRSDKVYPSRTIDQHFSPLPT